MRRKHHPLQFKPRVTLLPLWGLSLLLVAVLALLLPGSQRLLAGWREHPATNSVADDWVMTEPAGELSPSLAPRQQASPSVARSASPRTYVVQDPNAYVYTVRLGEYWIGIARRFGIEYPELRAANPELWNLRKEVIRPGDQMVIPNLSGDQMVEPITYVVTYGDSWYKIANMFGISYWDLRLDNVRLWQRRGIYIRPGDEMTVKGAQQGPVAEARAEEIVEAAEEVTPPVEEVPQPAETTESPILAPEKPATTIGTPLPPSSADAPILAPQVPEGATRYTVRPGDSWFRIAAAYGITFLDLRTANPALWATRGQSIRVGDQMVIPPHGSPPPPPEIRLVPVEPEEAIEEAAIEEEAIEEEAIEEEAIEEEAIEEEAIEEAVDEAVELSPVLPEDVVTPIPLPTVELDEERVGPMQAATPEAGRLRIELAEPTIIYVVQAGDDWATVAARTGVTVEALQAANPALSARALQVGDQLRLP
jgi:LysM repeat protein